METPPITREYSVKEVRSYYNWSYKKWRIRIDQIKEELALFANQRILTIRQVLLIIKEFGLPPAWEF